MSEKLSAERLAELREVSERALNLWPVTPSPDPYIAAFGPRTALALLDLATRTADLSARMAAVEALARNLLACTYQDIVGDQTRAIGQVLTDALAPHTPTDAARAVDAENGEEHG